MHINGTASVHGPQAINPPHRVDAPRPTSQAGSVQPADELTISSEASVASQVNDLPDVRHDVVNRIKAEIAVGTYETEERLDGAVSALLDELV